MGSNPSFRFSTVDFLAGFLFFFFFELNLTYFHNLIHDGLTISKKMHRYPLLIQLLIYMICRSLSIFFDITNQFQSSFFESLNYFSFNMYAYCPTKTKLQKLQQFSKHLQFIALAFAMHPLHYVFVSFYCHIQLMIEISNYLPAFIDYNTHIYIISQNTSDNLIVTYK